VKKNEMHRACSTHGKEGSLREVCGGENLKERGHLKLLGYREE
jgi:hypothetical protein